MTDAHRLSYAMCQTKKKPIKPLTDRQGTKVQNWRRNGDKVKSYVDPSRYRDKLYSLGIVGGV